MYIGSPEQMLGTSFENVSSFKFKLIIKLKFFNLKKNITHSNVLYKYDGDSLCFEYIFSNITNNYKTHG